MSLQWKHSSAPEVQKKTLSTNSWLQSSGSQEFVSLSPVAVKTEPQNSVQDYYSANPTVQTSHPVRATPAAWPVSEATYCQRSSSSSSMTKASKTIKTFQEHDPTIESKFVSHIKLEPIDNLEYGQPHPTLSLNASTWNLSLIKINPSRDTSESTKSTTCASPLLFIISNIHQKYARNWIKSAAAIPSLPPPTGGKVVSSTPLPPPRGGKIVSSTCDESAMINLTGKKRFNATGKSEQSTSDTPYPVLLFSSEMENLPLNISKTAKSEQYVDLTS